jgi:hypothetical protein
VHKKSQIKMTFWEFSRIFTVKRGNLFRDSNFPKSYLLLRGVLWYPQIKNSHSFSFIRWSTRFHTCVQNMTSIIHTCANYLTALEKVCVRAGPRPNMFQEVDMPSYSNLASSLTSQLRRCRCSGDAQLRHHRRFCPSRLQDLHLG